MCGIFGIIANRKNEILAEDLGKYENILSHRGSDVSGTFKDEKVVLIHNRLAIFDLSDKGAQPMAYKHLNIIFNGAIYNFVALRENLISKGYSFISDTDTEVILASYLEFGSDCVKHFNGQWSFAIYDNVRQEVFCSRDRFGIKPFYYTVQDSKLIFASEIKALKLVSNTSYSIDDKAVQNFLAYGMHDYNNNSFYKEIKQLPKGSNMIIAMDTLDLKFDEYYSLDGINVKSQQSTDIEDFRNLLVDSISIRLRADVPIGSALSGGLDSSIIALNAEKLVADRYKKTYSIVYESEKVNESKYLQDVLKGSKIVNKSMSPDYNTLNAMVDEVLYHQDEPFDGYSVIAQAYLFKEASREGIKVMLDGQGADEILAGYEKFYFQYLKSKIFSNPLMVVKQVLQLKKQFPQFKIFERLYQYIARNKSKYPSWIKEVDGLTILPKYKVEKDILSISKNLLNNLGIAALLRYEDRNAMAYGIESRVPFLDHRLVEFCLSLPENLKVKGSKTKWILRESMKNIIPESLYNRTNKLGFATPHQSWLEAHKGYIIDQINLDKSALSKYVDFDSFNYKGQALWRVLIVGKWLRAVI